MGQEDVVQVPGIGKSQLSRNPGKRPLFGTPCLPILIEAKSAGDFTNVNKRWKEEAIKMTYLKATYGNDVVFVLFLCGYLNAAYLGNEAAEGIDWIWEHRSEDLDQLGI